MTDQTIVFTGSRDGQTQFATFGMGSGGVLTMIPLGVDSSDLDSVRLIPPNGTELVEFVLVDNFGTEVVWGNIQPNTMYFLAAKTSEGILVVDWDDETDSFFFTDDSPNTSETVRFLIPTNLSVQENDISLTRYLLIQTSRFVDRLPELIIGDSDCEHVFFSPIRNGTIDISLHTDLIGQKCTPDCSNKRCFETDGCGRRCTCPPGTMCNFVTGVCDPVAGTRASVGMCDGMPCGSLGGICEGKCPSGSSCHRTGQARFVCNADEASSTPHYINLSLALLVVLGIGLYVASHK